MAGIKVWLDEDEFKCITNTFNCLLNCSTDVEVWVATTFELKSIKAMHGDFKQILVDFNKKKILASNKVELEVNRKGYGQGENDSTG